MERVGVRTFAIMASCVSTAAYSLGVTAQKASGA